MLITIPKIRTCLSAHEASQLSIDEGRQAAVAMVLRDAGPGVEMLFIERARRREDPWSGQMALPGGMVEPEDSDPQAAAERETAEEVGLSVGHRHCLGWLGDMQGRYAGRPIPMVISCFVYQTTESDVVRTNEEVEDTLWVPLDVLLDASRRVDVQHPRIPNQSFQGIQVSDIEHQVVWGLTHRFLGRFFDILGLPFSR
jgi:8-oxo-dGTP pyrophosphatase MutT (NUDIX family)